MKVTTYAVMAGVVLALGLLPSASEAFCPCAGTPGDSTGACAQASNPGQILEGPNGCTADPTGLLIPNATDAKGCIEDPDLEDPPDGDCEVCVGGSVDTAGIVQGCACTADPFNVHTCVCLDTTMDPPLVVPCSVQDCMTFADRGCA